MHKKIQPFFYHWLVNRVFSTHIYKITVHEVDCLTCECNRIYTDMDNICTKSLKKEYVAYHGISLRTFISMALAWSVIRAFFLTEKANECAYQVMLVDVTDNIHMLVPSLQAVYRRA